LTYCRKLLAAMAALALVASLAFSSQARADTLTLGGTAGPQITLSATSPYDPSQTVQGGNVPNSTLASNGAGYLPWVYCVDLQHNITIPGTYDLTTTTTTGIVNGAQVGGSTTVSDQVAYLLVNYGSSAITSTEGALQAAIWTLEYGAGTVSSISTDGTIAQMNAYVADAQAHYTVGERADVTWLTPNKTGGSPPYQGLVTITNLQIQSIVPEPSTLAIAGLGALGFLGYGWKLRKRS